METVKFEMIKLVASEGHFLANKDNDFYCREVYLGKGQTVENCHSITVVVSKALDAA